MEYFLKQIEPGNQYPLLISLHQDEMKIGRSTITSLSRYNRVSRYHASFTRQNGVWYITDLKSMNWLYVNLERVHNTVQVNIGDIIGFGSPNVSKDGGFVCVLAARNKVVVKQEPPDDDDCVIIPAHSVNIPSASVSTQNKSAIPQVELNNCKSLDFCDKGLYSIKLESDLHLQQNNNIYTATPLSEQSTSDEANYSKNSNCLNGLKTSNKEIPAPNPLPTYNIKIEYDNESSSELSVTIPRDVYGELLNAQASPTYPGLKHLEEHEKYTYHENITNNNQTKGLENTVVKPDFQFEVQPKETFCLSNVKKEPDDCNTDIIGKKKENDENQRVTISSPTCSNPFNVIQVQSCTNIDKNASKQPIVTNELSKSSSGSFSMAQSASATKMSNYTIDASVQNVNKLHVPDKTKKQKSSSQSILLQQMNLDKKFEENSNCPTVSYEEIKENSKDETLSQSKSQNKRKNKKINEELISKPSLMENTVVRSEHLDHNKLMEKPLKCYTKSTKSRRKDSEITKCTLKASNNVKFTSKLDRHNKSLPFQSEENNCIKDKPDRKETVPVKKDTFEANLKAKKRKILDSESEPENKEFNHPPKSSTNNRNTFKRKNRDNDDGRNKNEIKDRKTSVNSQSTFPSFSSDRPNRKAMALSVRSRSSKSTSEYSDDHHSIALPANIETHEDSHKAKSKSLGRTLLIDSMPMEYRPKYMRGREEWFQERSGELDVKYSITNFDRKTCSMNISDKKSGIESNEISNSGSESSKKRKSKIHHSKQLKSIKDSKSNRSKLMGNTPSGCEISQNSAEHSSLFQKRLMPPVPKRQNKFSSRMGFLLDSEIIDKKSNTNKHDSKKKNQKLDISSKNKLQFDVSLEVEINAEELHKQVQTFRENKVKNISEKNFVESKNLVSVTSNQSFNKKISPKMSTREHEQDLWMPISECSSKQELSEKRNKCESPSTLCNYSYASLSGSVSTDMDTNTDKIRISPKSPKDATKGHYSKKTNMQLRPSSTTLMEIVVNWNPKWLIEQQENKYPPPLITKGASYPKLSFSSYESYVTSYFPMIILEVWENLFKECNPHLISGQLNNYNNFLYVIKGCSNRRESTELKCESVVSDDEMYYCPMEFNIVLLNTKDKLEDTMENYIFGCIKNYTIEVYSGGDLAWDNIFMESPNNLRLVKFEVVIKKSKRLKQLNSICLGHGLSNIKNNLHLADALRSLQNSSLCRNVYRPYEDSLMFCDSSKEPQSVDGLGRAIFEEIQNSNCRTNVLLLQAPCGTGKTRCVVDVLNHLLLKNPVKSKVLVCAPSCTALDEIIFGFVQFVENLSPENSLKFVRIGEDETMHPYLKKYSLANKVKMLYKEDCVKKMYNREYALKQLEDKINAILFRQNSQDMYRKVNQSSALKTYVDKMEVMKSKNLLHHMDDGVRKGYECIILQESVVLFSTLDCCMLPTVQTFLKNEAQVYCIVDEAAQCNELQIIQCLYYENIKKLILLGDTQQPNPTVVSKCAKKYGFGRSIVERLILNLKKKFKKIPCPLFKEQYRMHSDICHFPAKYFYNSELSTAKGTDEKYSKFPLKPYTVLDVLDSGHVPDDTESSLIMYICSVLVQICPTATIGIIISEKEQRNILLPSDTEYGTVELNTLEGFRGREKDIILIPCIRKPSNMEEDSLITNDKMMNMAITRAKQCLIICGQITANAEYSHWNALMQDASLRNCYLCVASLAHVPLVFTNYIKKM